MTRPQVGKGAACFLALTVAVVGAGACGGENTEASGGSVSVVDSAGIQIVSSAAPSWVAETAWERSERPVLTIGVADGDEAYLLYRVRAAIRLPDGRIAVANQGTSQVRIYDATGRHVADLGREGQGPGEFIALADLWRGRGDSIVAADNRLQRLSVFDADGRLGRTIALQPGENARQVFGRRMLDDGRIVASSPISPSEPPKVGLFDGGVRRFDLYSAEGSPLGTIGGLPQGMNWGWDSGNPYGPTYTSAPFAIFSPPHASDGETVFLGAGTEAQVGQWSPEGELLRLVRWGAAPRPVTPELQEAYRQVRVDGAGEEYRATTFASLEGLVFPDALPVYQTLMTDAENYLWVEPYAPDWEDSNAWWVFAPSGEWLGEVTFPPGFTLLDAGSDYVLGVARDEQDVERIVVYGLDRGAAP